MSFSVYMIIWLIIFLQKSKNNCFEIHDIITEQHTAAAAAVAAAAPRPARSAARRAGRCMLFYDYIYNYNTYVFTY